MKERCRHGAALFHWGEEVKAHESDVGYGVVRWDTEVEMRVESGGNLRTGVTFMKWCKGNG